MKPCPSKKGMTRMRAIFFAAMLFLFFILLCFFWGLLPGSLGSLHASADDEAAPPIITGLGAEISIDAARASELGWRYASASYSTGVGSFCTTSCAIEFFDIARSGLTKV